MILLSIILLFSLGAITETEIIAYDCADESTQMTRISLLNVKPCLDPRNATNSTMKRIQLIQKRQYETVHVFSCLVSVQQVIFHCGMHSHISAVAGGYSKYIHYIGQSECLKAHRENSLDLRGLGLGIATRLFMNGSTEISATLHGHITTDGTCNGVKFSAGENIYKDVIVQATVTITLRDYTATANVERNSLKLKSGTVCIFGDGYCFDDGNGETSWTTYTPDICNHKSVDVLYEGNATILTLSVLPPVRYIVVETEDTVFALKLKKPETLCHQQAWQTEQNRLSIIFEDSLGFFYHRTTQRIPQNVDIMAQVMSKLLYLEIAVRRQMGEIIYDSIYKRCQLREKILQNRIALAIQNPHTIGNLIKKEPGYVSRVMGEVLYIAKCKPVVVEPRKTESCYQELPVTYNNQSQYRTAITHILTTHGTEVDCNPFLPPVHRIEGRWVEFSPIIKRTDPAKELDANEEQDVLQLKGVSPLSDNGIFTKEDMEKFQNVLLFPTETEAISNQIARRITGRANGNTYYMPNIFSQDEFKSLALSAAEEVWGFLSKMGNIFSILGFIYTMFCVISYVVGVITNYFTLHKLTKDKPRRRKKYLWASLWQSLAHRYLWELHQQRIDNNSRPTIIEMSNVGEEEEPEETMYPRVDRSYQQQKEGPPRIQQFSQQPGNPDVEKYYMKFCK